jgi:hypothetical protein
MLATQIQSLRSEIQNRNVDISRRRLELARRRSGSESAKYQLAERETGALTSIQNNHKRTDHLWNSLHTKTAEARIFLCREVASLYGLRQKVRKRDNGLKESYMIGGVNIFDLRDLNGKLFLSSLCVYHWKLILQQVPIPKNSQLRFPTLPTWLCSSRIICL